MFLFGIDAHLCVYIRICVATETDSVQFAGPESGCVRKCWNGNAISYARKGKRLRKQNKRDTSRERERQKASENVTDQEERGK